MRQHVSVGIVQRMHPRSRRASDEFRLRLAELGVQLLETRWLGSGTGHEAVCSKGHPCKPVPNHVQQGQGPCWTCSGNLPGSGEAAFRAALDDQGATFLEIGWFGSSSTYMVRCAKGHEYQRHVSDVVRGQGCWMCSGRHPGVAEANFRAALEGMGATPKYDRWLGCGRRHAVTCRAGHECFPMPTNVQRGQGICKKCLGTDTESARDRFLAALSKQGVTLLDTEWRGTRVGYEAVCANGHPCLARPMGVSQGEGACQKCAGKVWDVFYVVASARGDIKFGITSGDPRPRLTNHRSIGYTQVVRLWTSLPDGWARKVEDQCKAALSDAGISPHQGREYFPAEALPVVLDIADGWLGTLDMELPG